MQPEFNIEKVSLNYRVGRQDVTVLNNVSFQIEKGDFLIIFGPSGCGKSTLLHILLGLQSPLTGRMIINGIDIYRQYSEDERADFRKKYFGMVFQQSNWIKSLSVKENVAFPEILNGSPKTEALETASRALSDLSMTLWADNQPDELSSGQQQKVAVARAVSTSPDVIVSDEPTGNLDRKSGVKLMKLLAGLNQKGKTIIMVTHDTDYLAFATKAVEMLDGRIVKIYTHKEIKKVILRERSLFKP